MKNFGEKIRLIREEKGYSQEAVASELGLSVSGYGKIERGQTELTVNKAFEISKVLGVSAYKILDISETNNQDIKSNEGICIYTNQGSLNNFNKEAIDLMLKSKQTETDFLKTQLKHKDELINSLMKKMK